MVKLFEINQRAVILTSILMQVLFVTTGIFSNRQSIFIQQILSESPLLVSHCLTAVFFNWGLRDLQYTCGSMYISK